jgi:pyruvate/2-oxoacid:ferredoxin oxidoreductase alpha subunit
MGALEQRAEADLAEDAQWLLVACNTPARMARGAVQQLRAAGIRAGLFRPVTLWPFPVTALLPLLRGVRGVVVVEAGPGQLEDELRLGLSLANAQPPPIHAVRHHGGVLPQTREIVERVSAIAEANRA